MRTITLLIFAFASASVGLSSQQGTTTSAEVSRALVGMGSQLWTDRRDAVEATTRLLQSRQSASDAEQIRLGLVRLLSSENVQTRIRAKRHAHGAGTTATDAEEYSEYYASLVRTVAGLRDPRSIPALLGAAGSGGMATRGVAHFGRMALDPVVNQIKGSNAHLSAGAVFVLRDMLAFRTVTDADSHSKIKSVLLYALNRPEEEIKEAAIGAVEYLDDRDDFIPELTSIADSDPIKIEGVTSKDQENRGTVYPVRRSARSLLLKIANHELPVVDQAVRP